MTRCSEDLRRGIDRGEWEPSGADIVRDSIRRQKLKLKAEEKCLACVHWGHSKRVEAIMRETWGDQKQDPKDFYCQVQNRNWRKECPHAD